MRAAFTLLSVILWGVIPMAGARAQEAAISETVTVAELFSSQACVFCPQADRIFGDLIAQDNVIGLACHVDYFDVEQGALSRPFCTARQSGYMERLNAGPNYTPQLVLNGRYEMVGYKLDKVAAGVAYVRDHNPVKRLGVTANDQKQGYSLFPLTAEGEGVPETPWSLWLAVYDAPHDVTIAAGRNKGKKMTYRHIVSAVKALGPWDGATPFPLTVDLGKGQAGFVVLATQGPQGPIMAAGEYKKPADLPSVQAPEAVIQPEVVLEGTLENN